MTLFGSKTLVEIHHLQFKDLDPKFHISRFNLVVNNRIISNSQMADVSMKFCAPLVVVFFVFQNLVFADPLLEHANKTQTSIGTPTQKQRPIKGFQFGLLLPSSEISSNYKTRPAGLSLGYANLENNGFGFTGEYHFLSFRPFDESIHQSAIQGNLTYRYRNLYVKSGLNIGMFSDYEDILVATNWMYGYGHQIGVGLRLTETFSVEWNYTKVRVRDSQKSEVLSSRSGLQDHLDYSLIAFKGTWDE